MFNGTAKIKYILTSSSLSTYSMCVSVCRAFDSACDGAVSVEYTVIYPLWLKKRWSLLSQKSPSDNFLPLPSLFPLHFLFACSYSLSLCRSLLNNTFSLLLIRECALRHVCSYKRHSHTLPILISLQLWTLTLSHLTEWIFIQPLCTRSVGMVIGKSWLPSELSTAVGRVNGEYAACGCNAAVSQRHEYEDLIRCLQHPPYLFLHVHRPCLYIYPTEMGWEFISFRQVTK